MRLCYNKPNYYGMIVLTTARKQEKGGTALKILYFDLCSLPLFLLILITCYTRKMTKGNANRLFLAAVLMSLISAAADLVMAVLAKRVPLSGAEFVLETALGYIYLAVRNTSNAVVLLFLLSLTRMTSLLKKRWTKILYCLPNAVILLLLATNPFTHAAFTVTAEMGYARGPLMPVIYAMASLYGVCGFAFCIYSKRFLPANKWGALLSMYILTYLAVLLQFLRPELLLEMFCSAIGLLVIMFSVMRPEERMDSEVGMLSWASYQSDLRNILLAGERVQIAVIRMQNCQELRNYLGDHKYNKYLSEIAAQIRGFPWQHPHRVELYFERPGTIYLIADEGETGTENVGERLLSGAGGAIGDYAEMGVRFEPRVCLISVPEDLQQAEDIISLGHKFQKIDKRDQVSFRASEIVFSHFFVIEAHIEEILDRAIKENTLEMYYQPIYDVRSGSFHSAEALARIIDPEYGLIPPSVFIPAAETQGFIIPIGDAVLDQVFRFVSEHDLDALGLSYIEINLSVAQCMQSSLPEKIKALQEKYGVDPGQINLEITETTFENISQIMLENVNELIRMGYSFALDDYGIGYSSIQRVNHLPLKLIKIDKSMLDEVASDNGRMILEHTVRMMQSIDKQLVAEGAETRDEVDMLELMDCDYIQGFYFSKPLPAEEFLRFIADRNGRDTA